MGFKRMAREALLAAGLLSAANQAEATPFAGIEAAAAASAEAENNAETTEMHVTTERLRDMALNGLSIIDSLDNPDEWYFTRDNGTSKVVLQDAFGREIVPIGPDRSYVEIDGQRREGPNSIAETERGFVFVPEGYRAVETAAGTELHEEGRSYDQNFDFGDDDTVASR